MREQQFFKSQNLIQCVIGGPILPFFGLLKALFVCVHAVKEAVASLPESTELRALLLALHTTAG